MAKYAGAQDVYRELVDESKESWLLGLVAFAVFEEQRIEWMRHYEEGHGSLPDAAQVQSWYQQQPPGALLRAKGTAENALLAYSGEVSAQLDADYRKEIENDIVVSEIRELKQFWPQFGVNVAAGIVSTLLFSAILTIVAFLVFNDTSPVDMVKKFKQSPVGVEHGK